MYPLYIHAQLTAWSHELTSQYSKCSDLNTKGNKKNGKKCQAYKDKKVGEISLYKMKMVQSKKTEVQ